jgi:hypothetical protein
MFRIERILFDAFHVLELQLDRRRAAEDGGVA